MPRDLKDGEWVWSGYDKIYDLGDMLHDIGIYRVGSYWASSVLPHSMSFERSAGERYKTQAAAIRGAFAIILEELKIEEEKEFVWLKEI